MRQFIDVGVSTRDGVRLSTDIRMPDAGGPFPVLLVRTPYGNAAFPPSYQELVAAGYAVAAQDCRGRFDSEGVFDPLRHEARDGADTIAWIREQAWCDGCIGMFGMSYCGLTQLSAASERPPGLKAIVPGVMGYDLFKDLVYQQGVLNLAIAFGWGAGVAGRTGQSNETTDWDTVYRHLPLVTMDEAAGYCLPYFRDWVEHPLYDDYWRLASVEEHYTAIDVPAFHIGGWYDIYADGILRNFCGLREHGGPIARANQKIIMGPWVHGVNTSCAGDLDFGEGAVVPLDEMRRRWFDRWVKGEENGVEDEAPIRIFVMGRNVWRDEWEWPLARTQRATCFLGSDGAANTLDGNGRLTFGSGHSAASDSYCYDPDDPVPTVGGCCLGLPAGPTDHRSVESRDDVLVYTSEPLSAPLEVTGHVELALYASSDAVDTDFLARLCDVHPDGRSIILCDGIMATRFREGLDREVPMTPGTVYELTIEMGVTSNVFLPGHRIRLEITSSCFPRFARNLNTGEPIATGTRMLRAVQTIHHSEAYPSRLHLPIVPVCG